MIVKLPPKGELLEACSGSVRMNQPVLLAVRDLAALHASRSLASGSAANEIDCSRAELVRAIDRWVLTHLPQTRKASYLHTESVGMVVDRIAQYHADARTALYADSPELLRHFHWQRLAELAVAYGDLAFEISAGLRKVPALTYRMGNHSTYP